MRWFVTVLRLSLLFFDVAGEVQAHMTGCPFRIIFVRIVFETRDEVDSVASAARASGSRFRSGCPCERGAKTARRRDVFEIDACTT